MACPLLPYQTLLACPPERKAQCIADYLNTPMNSPTMAMACMGELFPHALNATATASNVQTPQMLTVPLAAPQSFTEYRRQQFFTLRQ